VTALLLASHPGPTAAVTLFAALLLVGLDAPGSTVAVATLAVLAGQLSVGWSNDWWDADRDRAVGRRDKPVVAGRVTPVRLRTAALVAAVGCVCLSLATGWRPGVVHLAAVACAWAYNGRLKHTLWSWLPFAVSFGLLPMFLVLTLPGSPRAAWWAVAGGGLLGIGAHVVNVLPDLEDDAVTGVRGLPHRWGRTRAGVAAPAVLAAAALVVVLGPRVPPRGPTWVVAGAAVALAAAAGVVAVRRPHSRRPFTLSMAVAALCVVRLAAAGPQLVAGG
jgi:4-hydroxybenzoate polyprenyltransferase